MDYKNYKYYCYPGHNTELIKWRLNVRGGWVEIKDEEEIYKKAINFVWKNTNFPEKTYLSIDKSGVKDKFYFNHFESVDCVVFKNQLISSLNDYYKKLKSNLDVKLMVFDIIPLTYVVTSNIFSKEYRNFIKTYRDIESGKVPDCLPEKHCKNNIWIIKPNNQSEGKGIKIFKNLNDIENFIGTRTNKSLWLIQKYIEYPLVYKEKKSDLRIWVLLTDKNEIFLYKNSFMKTSCYPYNIYDIDGQISHITSTGIQKNCPEYGKVDDGNTISIEMLDRLFIDDATKISLEKHILPRIIDIVIDVFNSIRGRVNFRHRKNCFELFCFNFLIDADYRIWLIDVTTTQEMNMYCRFMKNTLPKLVDDIFSLTIDKHYEPIVENFHFGLKENAFEPIYSDFMNKFNKRRAFDKTNFYPIPELIPKNERGGVNPFETKDEGITDKKYNELHHIFEDVIYNGKLNSEAFSQLVNDCLFVLLNFKKFQTKNVKLSCTVLKKISKTDHGNHVFVDFNHVGTMLNLMMSRYILMPIRQSICDLFENLLKFSKVKFKIIQLPYFLIILFNTLIERDKLLSFNKNLDINSYVFAIKVLFFLIKEERYYLPGETLNNVKMRKSLFKTHILFLLYDGLNWEKNDGKVKEDLNNDYEFQIGFLKKNFPDEVDDYEEELNVYKNKIKSINIFVFEKKNRIHVKMVKGKEKDEEKLNINRFCKDNLLFIRDKSLSKIKGFSEYIKRILIKKYILILNNKIEQEKHSEENKKIILKIKEDKDKILQDKKKRAMYIFEKKQEQRDNLLFLLRKSNDDLPIINNREILRRSKIYIKQSSHLYQRKKGTSQK